MTTVFIHFLFCLSLWQISYLSYGDCRGGNVTDVKPATILKANEPKLSKISVAEVRHVSNNSVDVGLAKPAERSNDDKYYSSEDESGLLAVADDKNKSDVIKDKKRTQEDVIEESKHKDERTSGNNQRPMSRGRLRFQSETRTETSKSRGLSGQSADSKLPINITATAPSPETVSSANRKNAENLTRSGRGSNFRKVGSDGYVFERTVDLDEDMDRDRDGTAGEFHFEPMDVTYVSGETENSIDKMRNYNENLANVELKNIVEKPQGFSVTTESHVDSEASRRSAVRPSAASTRRRPTNGVVSDNAPMISLTHSNPLSSSSTENNPTSFSKNEIARKPPAKANNRKRLNGNDNSLPTTSAVWALAALKTPVANKIPKRPVSESIRKNNVEMLLLAHKPTTTSPTTIKPFVLWSTRLQRTTTEDPTDPTTTLRPGLEVDAETIVPIPLDGPKLMNTSSKVQKQKEMQVYDEKTENAEEIHSTEPNIIRSSTILISSTGGTTSNTSTTTVRPFTEDDVRIDLVDDNSADKEHSFVPNTDIQRVVIKNSDGEFGRFNYSVDGYDVNETAIERKREQMTDSGESKIDTLNDSPVHHEEHQMDTMAFNNNNNNNNNNTSEDVEKPVMQISISESTTATISNTSTTSPATLTSMATRLETTGHSTMVTADNAESNIIFDQAYGSYKHKKIPPQSIVKSIEKTENVNKTNATTEKSQQTMSQKYPSVVANNSVLAAENRQIEPAETYPLDETVAEEKKEQQSSIMNHSQHSVEEGSKSRLNLTTGWNTMLENISTSSTTWTTDVPVDAVITTTSAQTMTSKPPSTTTTNFSTEGSSIAATATASINGHAIWPADEEISTDIITTSVSPSSPTTTPVEQSRNVTNAHSKFTNDVSRDSEEQWTTVPSSRRSTSSAPSSESFSIDYSSSEETTTPSSSTLASSTAAEEIPLVPSFKPNLPSENVPGYLMLFFKSTFANICEASSTLRENLFQYITQRSIRVQSKDQVVMVVDPEQCKEPDDSLRLIPVALYVVDDGGSYDKTLIEEMKKLLEEENMNSLPDIHQIVYHENIAPDNSRVIAAMVITTIAAVCFVLLIFLMCTIKNRQKLNYGQRCTPVSVDDYNLDNISDYNTIRRKGMMRASKRSYGNPAFDDPSGPSKPLTYNGLIKAVDNRSSLDEEFSQIPTVTVKPSELPPGAEIKNRYANVIPLPETRISLTSNNNFSDSVNDYINANYVKGFKDADKFYIACQAPLQNTIEDFWKMVWKEQTKVIIMLTALSENGIEKCVDYLPPSEILDCHRLFGDFQVTLKKREVKEKYVISTIQLKNMETNLWREIHHLWYTNWPIQGVPCEQSSIIAFLIETRAYMRNTSGPHVVHCSPGTGRTGTVLAIDICIRDYEMSRSVNIPMTVAKLRRSRAGAVQTKEQYAFIYKVLALYAKKLNGGAPLDSM